MTNKELLKEIRNIKKQLLKSEEDQTFDEQALELQEVFEKQEELQSEITKLEEQLANNRENYLIYGVQDALEHLNKIQDHLDEIEIESTENEASLARMRNRLRILDSEIGESKELESIGKQDEKRYQQENMEGKTALEIADIESKIQLTRNAVVDLTEYAASLALEKEQLLESIQAIETRQTKLTGSKQRYQSLFDKIEPTVKEGEILDNEQIEKDQNKLEQKRQELAVYNAKEAYLTFNCVNELEALEADIKTEKLDTDTIIQRLQRISSRAPFLPIDTPKEIEKNKKVQMEYQSKIEKLEEKLANEENYLVSSTQFEQFNKDIIALEMKKSDYEAEFKKNKAQYFTATIDRNRLTYKISKTKHNMKVYSDEIARLENALTQPISKKERRNLEVNLRTYRKEKEEIEALLTNLYEQKSSIDQQLEISKKEEKRFSKLQEKTTKILEQKKERLENKSSVDEYQRRMDEDELHDLTASLSALQARQTYLTTNIPSKFESLITKLKDQELVPKKEKKGIMVVFEKAHQKVVDIIKTNRFKDQIRGALGAMVVVLGFTGGVNLAHHLMKKDQKDSQAPVKVTVPKKPLNDTYPKKENFQIKVDDETYDVEQEDTNSNLEKKSIEEVSKEVIRGEWGNGIDRKNKLIEAGYTEAERKEIQKQVNDYFAKQNSSKPVEKPVSSSTPIQKDPAVDEKMPITPEIPSEPIPSEKPSEPIVEQPADINSFKITPTAPRPIENENTIETPTYTSPSYSTTIIPTAKTKEYTVGEGDTLLINTPQGTVAVDNSNGSNLENRVTIDDASNAIKGMEKDEKDSSIHVTVDTSKVTPVAPTQEELNQQILDDYNKILEEMGITDGRSK